MAAHAADADQRQWAGMSDPPLPTVEVGPVETVNHVLYRTTLGARRLIDGHMAKYGLTDAQWRPLAILSRGSADTTAMLAREMGIDAGALTRMLTRLEAKGLVERERSHIDRRVVHVRLTPEGRKVAARIPEAMANVDRQLLRDFTQGEESMLRLLCLRMQMNAKP